MSRPGEWTYTAYDDVWGNEEDGWQVNNLHVEFDDLTIADDASDKETLNYLKDKNLVPTSDMRRIGIDSSGDMLEIYMKKGGFPIGRLSLNC